MERGICLATFGGLGYLYITYEDNLSLSCLLEDMWWLPILNGLCCGG